MRNVNDDSTYEGEVMYGPGIKLVQAQRHGSDGLIAKWHPLACIHECEVSCVSGSGDSMCGGYLGHYEDSNGTTWVECGEDCPDPMKSRYQQKCEVVALSKRKK